MVIISSNLDSHLYNVAYGALFHDIGKFFWRADKTQPKRYSNLTDEDLGKSGAHSKWSAEFFHAFLKEHIFEPVDEEIIENLILYHHSPDSAKLASSSISLSVFKRLARIIQIADHTSAGERLKRDSEEDYGSTRTEMLHTVFSSVKIDKEFSGKGYYKLIPLTTGENARETIFPYETKQAAYGKYASDTQPLYKQLFNQFIEELNSIIHLNQKITFSTLYNLLLKYTINIPSATFVDVPDISLFHHMKSTAAIAVCLFQDLLLEAGNDLDKIEESQLSNPDKNRYLLVMGNISGIQNFIYSIASKGAAKGLKGRSFFVEYMGELISNYILSSLNLPNCCEIYCDGGNFYLLLPSCYEDQLKTLTLEIKTKLLSIFKGEIFIDIGWITGNRYNFSIEAQGQLSFNSLWEKINSKVGKLKFQRYNDVLTQTDGYNKVFEPQKVEGIEDRVCTICKLEKKSSELKNEEKKCALCQDFEKISQTISNANYIVLTSLQELITRDYYIKNIEDFSAIFKTRVFLLENKRDLERKLIEIRQNSKLYRKIEVISLNNTDLKSLSELSKSMDFSSLEINLGFKFISNVIPFDNNIVKDFDKIATNPDSLGDKKLGLLRMDIDNLGIIFSQGLKVNSLSRLSSLSFRLKLFFKYWINEICKGNIILEDIADLNYFNKVGEIRSENKEILRIFTQSINNNLYLIYSSGDDLFIIGHWNDILVLSLLIREIFTKYTLNNPNLTISGGIVLTAPRFPLYHGAELAGRAEQIAKSNLGKNSICAFNEAYSWEYFKELSELKEKLYEYYANYKLSKSFIHKLLQFNEIYREEYRNALFELKSTDRAVIVNKNKINLYYNVDDNPEKTAHEAAYYSKWYWRFTYYLKRTIERNKKLKAQLRELESEIVKGRKIKDLYLPTRWAELLTK